MNKRILFTALCTVALAATFAGPVYAGQAIAPANFGSTIDNPWHPLIPGTVMTYEGTKDDKPATQVITDAAT